MRRLLWISALVLGACSGGSDPVAPPPAPPPPPPAPAPVATVTVTGAVSSVLANGSVQYTATTKDASGNPLTGRTIVWSTTPSTAASISAAGLLTALVPGDVTVTATSEGKNGASVLTVVDPRNIPFFDKPFAEDWPVGNLLDHNVPKEHIDNNGTFLTFWGEAHPETGGMVDGHSGYDFSMPTGTPLLAVAAGLVTRAEVTSAPFFCPPLNRDVTQGSVIVEHTLPGGVKVRSWYAHISQVNVTQGQTVTAGQTIALSGNTGCSSAPHLHFEVFRVIGTGQRTLDPYGWTSTSADPWESHAEGTASIQLWKPGQAPVLQKSVNYFYTTVAPFSPLVLSTIVFEGVNDAVNPNNEYVELSLDTRMAATLSLNGYGLKPQNQNGLAYNFPSGLTLTAAQPTVRVYTGSGTNSGLTLYMGRPSGIWNNHRTKVCAVVTYPVGQSGVYFTCG